MPRALTLTALAVLLLAERLRATSGRRCRAIAPPPPTRTRSAPPQIPARPVLPQLPDAPAPLRHPQPRSHGAPGRPPQLRRRRRPRLRRSHPRHLADEGVPASFGMTGQWAQANPDLVAAHGRRGPPASSTTPGTIAPHRPLRPARPQTAAQIQADPRPHRDLLVGPHGQEHKPFSARLRRLRRPALTATSSRLRLQRHVDGRLLRLAPHPRHRDRRPLPPPRRARRHHPHARRRRVPRRPAPPVHHRRPPRARLRLRRPPRRFAS